MPHGAIPATFSGVWKCGVTKINMLTLVLHNWLPKESLHSESHGVPQQEARFSSASGYSPESSLRKTGGGRSERNELWGGSFLITTCSLLSMRTWSSADPEAEASVTAWPRGFWRFRASLQGRTCLLTDHLEKSVL